MQSLQLSFMLLAALFVSCCTVDSSSTAIYCEHSKGGLRCPRGHILNIISANYGRRTGASICPSPLTKVTNCGARISLAKVRAACQNKESCGLFASNSVFGDPCVQVSPSGLQMRATPTRAVTIYVCEGSRRGIACPQNMKLQIEYANYGRKNACPCPRPPILNTNCYSGSSNHKIRGLCQGKNKCSLNASNDVFGDPCRGTHKYIEVRYKCV